MCDDRRVGGGGWIGMNGTPSLLTGRVFEQGTTRMRGYTMDEWMNGWIVHTPCRHLMRSENEQIENTLKQNMKITWKI